MSACEESGDILRGELETDGRGTKRPASERSSTELPPVGKKKQAHRADVWQHFIQREDDLSISNCRYCGQEIGCDTKKSGTSAMKNHLARCKLYLLYKESGSQPVLGSDNSGVLTTIKYDAGLFRRSVNEMIVLNELPFYFVESEGFRRFCHNVLPMYTVHCRRTATEDIFGMFMREKARLKELFSCEKQRVSLTTDIWVAPTTSYSYMVVTAHWIDRNWDMQKRIISFKPITDHKGDTIAEHLSQCLVDWGIKKVFTVTVDNAKGNDKALRLFTDTCRQLGVDALVKDGALLHMRCCAHILNLIVKDGLAQVKESVVAIRNAVKYVRSSGTRLQSFQLRVLTGKVSRGSLSLDCLTRCNSTYLMLVAALKFRVAFEKLLAEDMLYNEYFLESEENGQKRVGPPIAQGWDEVQRLVKFLKLFFGCTLAFSASKTVTSTICYNEIVITERNLITLRNSRDGLLQLEAREMRKKFEKYWDGLINMNPLVIIASVFDPRNKMQFASICFDKLYGKDSVESNHLRTSIRALMKQLYEEYVMKLRPSQADSVVDISGESEAASMFDVLDDDDDEEYESRDSIYSEMVSEAANEEASSELDIYLMEKTVPRATNSMGLDLSVLSWWRRNSVKFPVLSELAKDVLAIQVSSVASESAFSTSGRILDPFRSCLTPYMLEALVCEQQWLRNTISAEKLSNLVQMFEELNFHDSLGENRDYTGDPTEPI
ncbi:HAT protein [Hirschfeldia incana]|nr:HAT protein [Hirschfeldia incana]